MILVQERVFPRLVIRKPSRGRLTLRAGLCVCGHFYSCYGFLRECIVFMWRPGRRHVFGTFWAGVPIVYC